jgi:uncharacterized cupin superfamily protein
VWHGGGSVRRVDWFVVNAADAAWRGGNGRSAICDFEGGERFPQLGINITVIEPGELATLYHEEDAQEDFLVLAGSCLLLIDGRERALGAWDFVHCPPGTPHAVVTGTERCILLQVGARPTSRVRYPVSEAARRHGVGVDEETSSVDAAYGARRRRPVEYGGWLAG